MPRSILRFALAFVAMAIPAVAGGPRQAPPSILIAGGTVIDGTGAPRRKADVQITGDSITEVGQLTPKPDERVIRADGLVVAPGFIDTHSHADGGLLESPDAESMIRQGITTSVVGQDGSSHLPLADWFGQVEAKHVAINIASFVGHGTLRSAAMHADYKRHSTPKEQAEMAALMDREMQAGGLGLSSGLEYDPGFYSDTAEISALARVASKYHGLYISHVRDEGDKALESFKELIQIAHDGHVPAQISHIKLDTAPSWGEAGKAIGLMTEARKHGLDITADVYPYLYWQSTIIVIIPTRDWSNRKAWAKGLADVGGAAHIRLTTYTPDAAWQGHTIAEIAASTGKDAISVIQEVVQKTHAPGATGHETVVVTAMTEPDLDKFIADPHIMFCTDGSLHGTHPRGAGSFPRILGVYVRERHLLTLEQAIHKAAGLPAARMSFTDRGKIAPGMKADVVLFDPAKVHDTATVAQPMAQPEGLPDVIVNGVPVLMDAVMTGDHPGMVLRHTH